MFGWTAACGGKKQIKNTRKKWKKRGKKRKKMKTWNCCLFSISISIKAKRSLSDSPHSNSQSSGPQFVHGLFPTRLHFAPLWSGGCSSSENRPSPASTAVAWSKDWTLPSQPGRVMVRQQGSWPATFATATLHVVVPWFTPAELKTAPPPIGCNNPPCFPASPSTVLLSPLISPPHHRAGYGHHFVYVLFVFFSLGCCFLFFSIFLFGFLLRLFFFPTFFHFARKRVLRSIQTTQSISHLEPFLLITHDKDGTCVAIIQSS